MAASTSSKAIYDSCDTYYYTLAEKLGISRIAKYATEFGLGQKTGIDLPQEVSGVMPSEEWKIKNYKQKWYAGETISVGIGQGAVAVTPIQLARAIGGITSDGALVRPHVAFPDQFPPGFKQTAHYNDKTRWKSTRELGDDHGRDGAGDYHRNRSYAPTCRESISRERRARRRRFPDARKARWGPARRAKFNDNALVCGHDAAA